MSSRRLACLLGAAVLSLHGAHAAAHRAAFTIEEVMQASFPSSLTAAPRGKAVAWMCDMRGSGNVWVADASHGMRARTATSFTEDDGFDIGELTWSPDAQLIAFTRGQTLEDERGAYLMSSPDGPISREVWVVSTTNGHAHEVASGHSPAFSPDGSRRCWSSRPTMIVTCRLSSHPSSPKR